VEVMDSMIDNNRINTKTIGIEIRREVDTMGGGPQINSGDNENRKTHTSMTYPNISSLT
jgi:hypothetical protein